jgi:hypothetical protein
MDCAIVRHMDCAIVRHMDCAIVRHMDCAIVRHMDCATGAAVRAEAPLMRAMLTVDKIEERVCIFSCSLSEFVSVVMYVICYSD